jgi:hypothetical protein
LSSQLAGHFQAAAESAVLAESAWLVALRPISTLASTSRVLLYHSGRDEGKRYASDSTNEVASGSSPIAPMTKAGHSNMKTTQAYMHLAGTVFRNEAEALERRLLGVEPSTNLTSPERVEADLAPLGEAESEAADAL